MTQPPGNTVCQVVCVESAVAVRSYRRVPGWSGGVGIAPVVSQSAVSRTTRAGLPRRSWSRVNLDQPLRTLAAPRVQPSGSDRTQGTSEAEGTDWASSQSGSSSSQPGLRRGERRQGGVSVDEHGPERDGEEDRRRDHQHQQGEAAGAPALDPDRLGPGGEQVEEFGVKIPALVAQHVA